MRMLADFMHNNAVTSVVDVGCGDWQFSGVMDESGIRYQRFDVVDTVDRHRLRIAAAFSNFARRRRERVQAPPTVMPWCARV